VIASFLEQLYQGSFEGNEEAMLVLLASILATIIFIKLG